MTAISDPGTVMGILIIVSRTLILDLGVSGAQAVMFCLEMMIIFLEFI